MSSRRGRVVLAMTFAVLVGWVTIPDLGLDARTSPRPPPDTSQRDDRHPPNILVIVTDDQRSGINQMSNALRVFKRRGVNLFRGFATTPLCCPSRASILSGRYMHNHHVENNLQAERLDQEHTIQAYLDANGYQTGLFGKFFNSWSIHNAPPHFDRWAFFAGQSGYYGKRWNIDGRIRRKRGYSTRIIMREALSFLSRSEQSDTDPFFAFIATSAPHAPAIPEHRYERSRVPEWRPEAAAFETDRTDKPPHVRAEHGAPSVSGHYQEMRTLMSVDDLIGRVFERLGTLDERNTLAFFVSDNGVLWGEHGLYGKAVPYTPSVRVPFFMRWPGRVPGGRRDGRLAANIDIAPTILDAAGIAHDLDTPMDGRSLLRKWNRNWLLLEYKRYNVFPSPSWASLRSRRSQYVEYYESGKPVVTFHEFYDLRRDPHQLENLLHNAERFDNPKVGRLHRKLARARSCSSSACP